MTVISTAIMIAFQTLSSKVPGHKHLQLPTRKPREEPSFSHTYIQPAILDLSLKAHVQKAKDHQNPFLKSPVPGHLRERLQQSQKLVQVHDFSLSLVLLFLSVLSSYFFSLFPGGQWVDEGAWCLGSKAGGLESWSCIHPWHLLPTSQALFGALQYILAVYR